MASIPSMTVEIECKKCHRTGHGDLTDYCPECLPLVRTGPGGDFVRDLPPVPEDDARPALYGMFGLFCGVCLGAFLVLFALTEDMHDMNVRANAQRRCLVEQYQVNLSKHIDRLTGRYASGD